MFKISHNTQKQLVFETTVGKLMVEVNELVQGAGDQIEQYLERKKTGVPVSFCLPGFALLSLTE